MRLRLSAVRQRWRAFQMFECERMTTAPKNAAKGQKRRPGCRKLKRGSNSTGPTSIVEKNASSALNRERMTMATLTNRRLSVR